jgi:hypothetical protein
MVFAEDGAVSWEVIADPALTEADIATLDQINQVQPQPYYAALAMAPDAGLASEFTALAANYHDEENARAAALAACEANRGGRARPASWRWSSAPRAGNRAARCNCRRRRRRRLQNEYRALPRRSRVMAISPTTGRWGVGEGAEAALEACGAPDCTPVIEG